MSDMDPLVKQEAPHPMNPPPPYEQSPHTMSPPLSHVPVMVQPSGPHNINMTSNAIIGAMGNCNVGPKRMNTFCQNCQSGIKTDTKVTHKCSTHCCCIILALTGVLCPYCCIPYCIASPETVVHNCPNCKAHIGTYYG